MVALILTIVSFNLLAVNLVDSSSPINVYSDEQRRGDKTTKTETKSTKKVVRTNYKKKFLVKEAENKALRERLHNLQNSRLGLDFTTSFNIPSGTTLKGELLNSVVSTNLSSPVNVRVQPNKYIDEVSTLQCEGQRADKRIYVACDKLIIGDEEYSGLVTNLLNYDGSNGLKGEYWSGEERLIAGIAVTSLASGVILASQDTRRTQFGDQNANTGKNAVINGVANTTSEATRFMGEKLKVDSGVVTLNAGEKVLVYFKGGFRI